MINEEEIQHPSFGMISIHRINGHSGHLFGSNVAPNNFIEIHLDQAIGKRDLTDDRYCDMNSKPLFRVKMSKAQFAEFISTAGYSMGTPCTIVCNNGEEIEQVDDEKVENRKQFVQRKFKERMREFTSRLKERQEYIAKAMKKQSLSKNDKQEIKNYIDSINTEIASNIPFFAECFQETMDNIIVDAKCEIDAAVQHKITLAGLEALGIAASRSNEIEK